MNNKKIICYCCKKEIYVRENIASIMTGSLSTDSFGEGYRINQEGVIVFHVSCFKIIAGEEYCPTKFKIYKEEM
jgi:hypothetical protein